LRTHIRKPRVRNRIRAAAGLAAIAALAVPASAAAGGSGGIGTGDSGAEEVVPGSEAKLVNGRAIAPADAPPEVVAAIKAGNRIRKKPYKYGGGHQKFRDRGYDCSGAVSFVLHKAGLLDSPLDSSGLAKWGKRGKGAWITVMGNPGHAYAVIAGLRYDTSMTAGDGPGWSKKMRPARGYKKRHWQGL
jgi:cell wall-associated NlpC family hydrolase